MVSAEQFVAVLEQKDLLPNKIIAGLRKEVEDSQGRLDAGTIAERLVRQNLLTRAIVERILASAAEGVTTPERRPNPPESREEELGFAPLDDAPDPRRPTKAPRPPETKAKSADQVAEPHDGPHAEREKHTGSHPEREPRVGKTGRPSERSKAAPGSDGSLLDEELAPLEGGLGGGGAAGSINSLLGSGTADDAAAGAVIAPVGRRRWSLRTSLRRLVRLFRWRPDNVRLHQADQSAQGLVVDRLLRGGNCAAGVGLRVVLVPLAPVADTLLQTANLQYDTGEYAEAFDHYNEFLRRFPKHPKADSATAQRSVLEIRLAVEESRAGGDWFPANQTAHDVVKSLKSNPAADEIQKVWGWRSPWSPKAWPRRRRNVPIPGSCTGPEWSSSW